MVTLESLEGRPRNWRASGPDFAPPALLDTTFRPPNRGPISDPHPDAEKACLNETPSFQDNLFELFSKGAELDKIPKQITIGAEWPRLTRALGPFYRNLKWVCFAI